MPVLLPPEEAANWLCESAERLIAARGAIVMALDGQAAAGKTTLAAAVASRVPGAFVVHMDDFFLPPEKRTPEYAARTLANADIERFSEEVLLPLAAGGPVSYRPYRFHPTPCFLSPVHLPGDRYHNWETHAQMRARAIEAIRPYLARQDISKLLIVCHGGIMRALMNQPSLKKIHFCEIRELTPEMLAAE